MQTEISVEILVQIVESVFMTMMSLDVSPSDASWKPTGNRLTSFVHLTGDWNGAVMLDSIFFCGGEAIHVDPTSVGSHGCVHVDQAAADRIFETVTYFGKEDTAICID